jgi:uncharacterized protein
MLSGFLPESVSPGLALLFFIASFFTSALTASFGIGGGVALMALMGMSLPVASLIPVHGLVQLGSNCGRALHQRSHVAWTTLAPFLIGAMLGAVIGASAVIQLPDDLMKLSLGIFVLVVTWVKLPNLNEISRTGMGLAGTAVAFLSMLFGASGPLLAAFFEKQLPERKEMVATSAAAMILVHGLKVITFAFAGFAFTQWLGLIAAMIASGYVGTIVGSKLLNNIPEKHFRFGFKIVLSLLAIDLIRRGLS